MMKISLAKKDDDILSTSQRWKGKMDRALQSKEEKYLKEKRTWEDGMTVLKDNKDI